MLASFIRMLQAASARVADGTDEGCGGPVLGLQIRGEMCHYGHTGNESRGYRHEGRRVSKYKRGYG